MDEPLQAHTPNELRYYLMVTPCASCGRGPWAAITPEPLTRTAGPDGVPVHEATVRARCRRCGGERAFRFRWTHNLPGEGEDAERINPGLEPSRIVDLGQWVSLYSLLAESAKKASTPAEARRIARQAHLCLGEALKFFGEADRPPESAFFTEAGQSAWRQVPQNYTRQALRDLQAKLPRPVRRAAPAGRRKGGPRPWWRFWG